MQTFCGTPYTGNLHCVHGHDCINDSMLLVYSAADAGFTEGGFCNSIARGARAKILGPRPLWAKPRPFSSVLSEASCPICQSLQF